MERIQDQKLREPTNLETNFDIYERVQGLKTQLG